MDTTAVYGELVEYSKEQSLWAFLFLSAAVWARFLKLKRIVESENRFGHGRTGRISCAGLVFVRLHTKHFSREVGLLCLKRDYYLFYIDEHFWLVLIYTQWRS